MAGSTRLLLWVVCVLSQRVAFSFNCGAGDPHLEARYKPLLLEPVTQAYHTVATYDAVEAVFGPRQWPPAAARRLQQQQEQFQNYSSAYDAPGPGFVEISQLDAAGQTRSIRIFPLWDSVNAGAMDGNVQMMCTSVGQMITVAGQSAPFQCQAEHVVVPGNARYNQMVSRTAAAAAYWGSTLRVRPVLDNITINSVIQTRFHLDTASVPTADVVLIMTAEPSPNKPIAGFATCLQRDQFQRCTVGLFNWVPELINLATPDEPDTVTSELHTAIHEIVHVLGGMGPGAQGTTTFIDGTGAPVTSGVYYQEDADPAYGKPTVYIVTPRVVNVTRAQLACETIPGFPLEDLPLGAGGHWEARLAGGELMSYGTYSTITFISDLTLAFLEDTNQYVANYSQAGRIPTGVPDADTFVSSGFSLLQSKDAAVAGVAYTPPPPPSPGHLLWGRGAGCGLYNTTAKAGWPALNAGLTCTQQQSYGCTADNRMSAVCVVVDTYTAEAPCASNGIFEAASGSFTAECGVTNPELPGSGGYGVAPRFQYFSTDNNAQTASSQTAATAATTGGQLNSMDYVPVFMGYWSCQDTSPISNGTQTAEQGYVSKIESLFSSSEADMALFGGQARCANCRCFESSLLELTLSVNPKFPVYGLCYRFNCYRSDYLQVAVVGQLGSSTVYWYGCPPDGGKLYIPGFSGALHCPAAVPFCAYEAVTGIKYAEQNVLYEAIFWGILVGGALLCLAACACRCSRDPLLVCCKRCCGALQFEEEFLAWTPSNRHLTLDRTGAPKALPVDCCGSWFLVVLNALELALALVVLALSVWAIATSHTIPLGIHMVLLSFLVAVLASVGIAAARARADHGPSCWILTYFFATGGLFILLSWGVLYLFAYSGWSTFVAANWADIEGLLPASYRTGATTDAQIASAEASLRSILWAVAGVATLILAVQAAALYAASRIIHLMTLATMTICVCGYAFAAFGLLEAAVGFYIVATGALTSPNTRSVIGVVIASGFFFLAMGVGAEVGVFRRSRPVLIGLVCALVASLGLLAFGLYVFVSQGAAMADYINGMSDADVAHIVAALRLSYSRDEVVAQLQDSLHQLAIAAGVVAVVCLVLIADIVAYLHALDHRGDVAPKLVPAISEEAVREDAAAREQIAAAAAEGASAAAAEAVSRAHRHHQSGSDSGSGSGTPRSAADATGHHHHHRRASGTHSNTRQVQPAPPPYSSPPVPVYPSAPPAAYGAGAGGTYSGYTSSDSGAPGAYAYPDPRTSPSSSVRGHSSHYEPNGEGGQEVSYGNPMGAAVAAQSGATPRKGAAYY